MFNAFLRSLSFHPSTRWLFKELRLKSKGKSNHRPLRTVDVAGSKGPSDLTISGVLESGRKSEFAVNGYDFRRDSGTWVFGDIGVGASVTVTAARRADGSLYAKKISVGAGS